MSAPPSLAEKLANVQHMPSLLAATMASDKPTEVYLIRDIVKMSYESIQTRIFLQKYFTNSILTSRNVYVKIKVLQLVACLLQEGHPDFHRNLQKTPEAFKESANIKTTDVSMAGDCGRIRDLSNKVLDMLYEDPPTDRQCPYGATPRSNGDGRGLVGGGASAKGGGALGGRIQGFGSGNPSSPQSISQTFSNAVGTFLGTATPKPKKGVIYDEKYATLDYTPQSSSVGMMGGGATGGGGATYHGNQRNDLPYSNVGSEHMRGRPGGGWEDNTGGEITPTDHTHIDTTPTVANDNEQERRLVDEITTPGGVRVAPPKEDLKRFLSRCKVLDCLAVVEFLRLKLQSDDSQVISRTLFVIEALIRSDVPEIFSYLDLTLDELTSLSNTSQYPSVKAKATKLLHQLSAVESLVTTDQFKKVGNIENENEQLLEVGGANNNEEEKEQTSEFSSIFAGLTLSSSSASGPASLVKKPVKPVANTSSTGLLKGLTLTNDTPTKAPPTSHPSTGLENLLDLGEEMGGDGFDPLAGPVPSDKSHDILGGLTSLDDSLTTPTSSLPLQPILRDDTPLLEMGGTSVPAMPINTSLTMAPPTHHVFPGGLGPTMSVPPGGYQSMYPPQQQSTAMMYTPQMMSDRSSVQRPQPQTISSPDSNSTTGFGFLSKSSGKGGAFDFVQDEMKAAGSKK